MGAKKLIIGLLKTFLLLFFAMIGVGILVDAFLFNEELTREVVTGNIFTAIFFSIFFLFLYRTVWKERMEKFSNTFQRIHKFWSAEALLSLLRLFFIRFFAGFGFFVLTDIFIFNDEQTKEEIISNIGLAIVVTLITFIFDFIEWKETRNEKANRLTTHD